MKESISTLPKLLFISPTFPGGYKNGISMRAAMWLSVLNQKFEIYLLVIPIADGPAFKCNTSLSELCKRIHIARPSICQRIYWRLSRVFAGSSFINTHDMLSNDFLINASNPFCGISFKAIHVLRSYLTPALKPFLQVHNHPILSLDLDDVESTTNQRLAHLCEVRGLEADAKKYFKQSRYYESFENEVVPQFDRVFVCSTVDAKRLEKRGFSSISVLPNSMPKQKLSKLESDISAEFSFIFVGNFQYFPNQDAIYWLVNEIIPEIRLHAKQKFNVTLIGSGELPNLAELQKIPEIQIIQNVIDLSSYYQKADVAVVPIRAAGGTRLKIIEAFSFHVPVVSTSIGIEGLEATHARHALIADRPLEFAKLCLDLMNSPTLRDNIADNALKLFEDCYSDEILNNQALTMLDEILKE